MALALPRWIRAFDWPTLALIRERPNTRVSLRLRRNTLAVPTPPRGGTCAEIRSRHQLRLRRNTLTAPTPPRGGTCAEIRSRHQLRLRRNTLTAPTPPRGGTYLSKSSPPMYYPAPTRVRLHCSARTSPRSRHQLPCTNPRPLALLRTNKPSRAEWVAAVHHISVLMGPTRSLIAALSTPPTHLPPSVALRLPPFLGTRTRFEIKKGTGFFFDIRQIRD